MNDPIIFSQRSSTQQTLSELESVSENSPQRFLQFHLAGNRETFLPLQHVVELIPLERKPILPIPEMPAQALGVCSWRSELLWLVDFNILVGYTSQKIQSSLLKQSTVIVVQSGKDSVGLVVEQVNNVILLDPEIIIPKNNLHESVDESVDISKLNQFVWGYLPNHRGTILDVVSLVQYSLRHPV